MLAGCSGGGDDDAYPSLGSVPAESRPSLPVAERREIVRELIEERDRSQQQTVIVRRRSGLSPGAFAAAEDQALAAEDIIPDTPSGADPFRLTPGDDEVGADSVYRRGTEVEDGGLDDFIRQLKRDTSRPEIEPEDEAETIPGAEEQAEDETSFLLPGLDGSTGLGGARDGAVWLAAFAPVLTARPAAADDLRIRLAAETEEPGFFCNWLGWTVAWSSICIDEIEAERQLRQESEDGVSADVEDETGTAEDPGAVEDQDGSASGRASRSARSEELEEEGLGRRLRESELAEQIEEAGDGVLAPVRSSLDKLRDFMRARRSAGTESSDGSRIATARRSLSPEEPIDRPPLPTGRPEQREDITIVDRGEQFDFHRSPTPAFKPSYEEDVILPPAGRSSSASGAAVKKARRQPAPPPIPRFRPGEPVADRGIEQQLKEAALIADELERVTLAIAESAATVRSLEGEDQAPPDDRPLSDAALTPAPQPAPAAPTPTPAPTAAPKAASPAPSPSPEPADEPKDWSILDPVALGESADVAKAEPSAPSDEGPSRPVPYLITFDPDARRLPDDAAADLADLLAVARADGQKIYITGEAGTSHLARQRANTVGQALVRLGATAEILEYDYQATTGVDQVRLVLKAETPE